MAVEKFELRKAESSVSGAYPIPLVRATTVGFIGRTERGPVNEPVAIRSFAEYYQQFGGHIGDSFVSNCVQDFFLHGGGLAVIVRVTNRATRGEIHCPAAGESLAFVARFPGSQEVLRVSVDYDGVEDDPTRFNLVAQRLRRVGSTVIADQELFPGVSVRDEDDRFVVDSLRDSRLIAVSGPVPGRRPDATAPLTPGDPVRYIGMNVAGTDGDPLTDYDLIGSRSQGTGLFAFDRGPRIDLLAVPPPPDRDLGLTLLLAAERICAERKSIYIFDPPWSWTSAGHAVEGARSIASSSRDVFSYFPRIRPRGDRARFPNGLPACGALAGLIAQQDARGQWSGDTLALKTSLTVTEDLGRTEAEHLRRAGLNVFIRGAAGQTVLDGNRTLGSMRRPGRHAYQLSQCRLLGFLLTSIEDATRFALEYYDGDSTLKALQQQIEAFLKSLFEQGLFAGATPAQAFFCRAEGVHAASAQLRVGLALDRPGELVEFQLPVEPGKRPEARLASGLEAERVLY